MTIETSHFYTVFVTPRAQMGKAMLHWVSLTWHPPFSARRYCLQPGDLQKFLRRRCGKRAVGSISPYLKVSNWICDSQVPWAPLIPKNTPPKVTIIYGPSRRAQEMHLPEEYGTIWGGRDPRNGKSRVELYPEEYPFSPPPSYSK